MLLRCENRVNWKLGDKVNFDILLFDLDGTLTDSQEGIFNCVEYALSAEGIEVTDRGSLRRFIGPPLVDSFMQFYGFSRERAEKATAKYRERYAETGIFENRVYEGVPQMLDVLKKSGKRLAVATSKPEVYAGRILEKFGILQYFEVVTGAELDGRRNAKAEVIEECLKRLGVTDKGAVLMVGDRRHDVEGAKRCEIKCAGVRFGYADEGELEEAGADFIFDTPNQLAEELK